MAKISVLIPVYNAEKYLAACLDSLRNQRFSDFEGILVDDGSQDGSGKICDGYGRLDCRFQVFHRRNEGAGAARNAALEIAMKSSSSCIAWVDADDVLHPDYLKKLYAHMEENPHCDIVQCDYTQEEGKLYAPETPQKQYYSGGKEALLHFEEGIAFCVLWNKLYRKELWQDIRVRTDEKITGKIHNDVNLLWRVYARSKGICWVHSCLYYYRQVEGSIQHKKLGLRNLEIFELYCWMEAAFQKMPGYEAVCAYFQEKCLFKFAYLLRLPKDSYEDYPMFFQAIREKYQVLSKTMTLQAARPDLKLLAILGKRWFGCFRIYGRLYASWKGMEAHLARKRKRLKSRFGSRYYYLPKKKAHTLWFRLNHDYEINWVHPRTLDEKLHWLMVYAYGKREAHYADKFAVRQYVRDRGFGDMLPELYGSWKSPRQMDFSALPEKFVLKTNHASGADYLVLCRDKHTTDWNRELAKLEEAMKIPFARQYGEYHYGYIKPLILAEELLDDGRRAGLVDYKIYCFHGIPKCILTCCDRGSGMKRSYYSLNWQRLDYTNCPGTEVPRPQSLERMLEAAAALSKSLPFARVDFYDVAGKPYFGEITLTPAGGNLTYLTKEAQILLGSLLHLPGEEAKYG